MPDAQLRRHFVCRRLYHVYQRSSRSQPLFLEPADYREYLSRLFALARRYQVRVHAYCLLAKEVRLLLQPLSRTGISLLLQHLHSGYARWLHAKIRTEGHLFKHKYGAIQIQPADFQSVLWSIETQPVLHGLVPRPTLYPYSSAKPHALGQPHALSRYPELDLFWPLFSRLFPDGSRAWLEPIDTHQIPKRNTQARALLPLDPQAWRWRFAPATGRPAPSAHFPRGGL